MLLPRVLGGQDRVLCRGSRGQCLLGVSSGEGQDSLAQRMTLGSPWADA